MRVSPASTELQRSRDRRRPVPRPVKRRAAFTLLEVLLSSMISLLIFAALYVIVDLQLRHAQIAREVVGDSTLARALTSRIAGDISQSIAPLLPPPKSSGSSGNAAGGSSGSAASGSGTSAGSSTTGGASTSSNSSTTTPTSTGTAVVFNVGVQGDGTHLLLSMSRLPRELLQAALDPTVVTDSGMVSDLRRVAYWLPGSGDTPLGLARWEIKQATSDDAQNTMSNLPDDASHVIASEVKSLQFSFFDGSSWQDTWDGTTAGADGVTPIGPPVAIAITLGIASQDGKSVKSYRHVVFIPTANGAPANNGTTTGTATSPTG